jgi:hypothetical protein
MLLVVKGREVTRPTLASLSTRATASAHRLLRTLQVLNTLKCALFFLHLYTAIIIYSYMLLSPCEEIESKLGNASRRASPQSDRPPKRDSPFSLDAAECSALSAPRLGIIPSPCPHHRPTWSSVLFGPRPCTCTHYKDGRVALDRALTRCLAINTPDQL